MRQSSVQIIDQPTDVRSETYEGIADNTQSTDKNIREKYGDYAKPLSNYREIKLLFYKKKQLMKALRKIVELDNNILIQLQPDGSAIVFEGIQAGIYEFNVKNPQGNSDQAIHILHESKLYSMKYGSSSIRFWICSYKHIFPYPHDSKHDSITIQRLLLKYMAAEEDLRTGKWGKIGWAIFIVCCGFAIMIAAYFFFKKDVPTQIIVNSAANITDLLPK